MIKRISKPSFRLKSAHTVVFSPCGKYLAQLQDYARITLWDIKERSVIAKHKLIKNEIYIGFSSDSLMMYCKNANGELVFFETLTGKLISETGSFTLNRSGGCAQFLSDDSLIDGDSNGQIMIWDTKKSKIETYVEYKNHMIRSVIGVSGMFYIALVLPKHDEKSSGCRLMKFNEAVNLEKFELIKPYENTYQSLENWKNICEFCLSNDFKEIILVLDKTDQKTPQVLVLQDLKSSYSNSFELDKPNEYTWSVSNNDNYIIVVIHTNFYQQGMSSSEYQELNNNNETEHIHIFEKKGLKRVAKIHWPEVSRVAFHPNNQGVAIAANKNSVYLDDYSVLFDL